VKGGEGWALVLGMLFVEPAEPKEDKKNKKIGRLPAVGNQDTQTRRWGVEERLKGEAVDRGERRWAGEG